MHTCRSRGTEKEWKQSIRKRVRDGTSEPYIAGGRRRDHIRHFSCQAQPVGNSCIRLKHRRGLYRKPHKDRSTGKNSTQTGCGCAESKMRVDTTRRAALPLLFLFSPPLAKACSHHKPLTGECLTRAACCITVGTLDGPNRCESA